MTDGSISRVPWSFWVIGVATLVWNAAGAANFVMQVMNADMLDAYRESERAIIANRPAWATGAFAVGVFGGTLGCLLLLLRKSAAFYLFVASLAGVAVTMAHTLGLGIDFSGGEVVGIILAPLGLAVFLVGYAKYTERQDWFSPTS